LGHFRLCPAHVLPGGPSTTCPGCRDFPRPYSARAEASTGSKGNGRADEELVHPAPAPPSFRSPGLPASFMSGVMLLFACQPDSGTTSFRPHGSTRPLRPGRRATSSRSRQCPTDYVRPTAGRLNNLCLRRTRGRVVFAAPMPSTWSASPGFLATPPSRPRCDSRVPVKPPFAPVRGICGLW